MQIRPRRHGKTSEYVAAAAIEMWAEYDNVAYFVGAAYASPQEEARMKELRQLILAAERRATVERIRQAYRKTDSYRLDEHSDNLNAILDEVAGPSQVSSAWNAAVLRGGPDDGKLIELDDKTQRLIVGWRQDVDGEYRRTDETDEGRAVFVWSDVG